MSVKFFREPPWLEVERRESQFDVPNDDVVGWGWLGSGNPKKFYGEALKFSKSLGKKVVLYGTHADRGSNVWKETALKKAKEEDRFIICMWGGFWLRDKSKVKDIKDAPKRLFGFEVSCNDTCAIPSSFKERDGVIDTESKFPAAIVTPDYLGIVFDIYHNDTIPDVMIFREILKSAVLKLRGVKREEKVLSQSWDDFKKFKEYMVASIKSETETIKEKNKEAEDKIRRISRDLIRATREKEETASRLDFLIRTGDSTEKLVQDQIDRIKTLESFDGIKYISKNSFVFRTKPFIVKDPRSEKHHMLGPYEVTVNWGDEDDCEDGGVFIKGSKPRGIGGFHGDLYCHPHILEQEGRTQEVCFGSASSAIDMAMGRKDLVSTIFMISQFLGQANTADPAGWWLHRYPFYDIAKNKVLPSPPEPWYHCRRECSYCKGLEECKKTKFYRGEF